jgi:hypothetical protein
VVYGQTACLHVLSGFGESRISLHLHVHCFHALHPVTVACRGGCDREAHKGHVRPTHGQAAHHVPGVARCVGGALPSGAPFLAAAPCTPPAPTCVAAAHEVLVRWPLKPLTGTSSASLLPLVHAKPVTCARNPSTCCCARFAADLAHSLHTLPRRHDHTGRPEHAAPGQVRHAAAHRPAQAVH